MSKLLDDVDIINQRLRDKIDRLEKDLAKITDNNFMLHDNLAKCRDEIKNLKEIERKYKYINDNYIESMNVLKHIASGELENPIAYARKKLIDLSE